ncbi:mesenteric estrogen-dependent adipogenesis protein-like [Megalops cyprinoides]|uniref:mesenteric estrogen-dependent adipogenesis protein-like n=1 Tax=Megalops cyprinoides TaxID=118141 RepID=UPI00186409AE|nr:mesenteric estrogen-dependent adipogenesis protein-like [Megalops cyprinoides]
MPVKNANKFQMDVIDVEDFLRDPPSGFTVELRVTGYRFIRSDPDSFCVFIDEFDSAKGKVIFQNSPGRSIKVHTLKDYMHVRERLTSKRIVLMVSACEHNTARSKKVQKNAKVLKQYIVILDGNNPVIKWEMERGLDHTISSVAGESYKVKIDLSDLLQRWAGDNFHIIADGRKVKPDWRDAYFCLKYYTNALFDVPHWLGFNKRKFKISYYRKAEVGKQKS